MFVLSPAPLNFVIDTRVEGVRKFLFSSLDTAPLLTTPGLTEVRTPGIIVLATFAVFEMLVPLCSREDTVGCNIGATVLVLLATTEVFGCNIETPFVEVTTGLLKTFVPPIRATEDELTSLVATNEVGAMVVVERDVPATDWRKFAGRMAIGCVPIGQKV